MKLGTYVDGRPLTYDDRTGVFRVAEFTVTPDEIWAYWDHGQIGWGDPELSKWFELNFPRGSAAHVVRAKRGKSGAVKIGLAVAAVLVVLGLVGAAVFVVANKQDETPVTTAATTTGSGAAEAPSDAGKQWTPVKTMSGSKSRTSKVFQLSGAKARISYDIQGDQSIACAVYITPAGGTLRNNAVPEVSANEAGTGSSPLSKGPGDYVLVVNSGNCKWSLKVEELK